MRDESRVTPHSARFVSVSCAIDYGESFLGRVIAFHIDSPNDRRSHRRLRDRPGRPKSRRQLVAANRLTRVRAKCQRSTTPGSVVCSGTRADLVAFLASCFHACWIYDRSCRDIHHLVRNR